MKIYVVSLEEALKKANELRRLRFAGNIITVYSEHNRKYLRSHYDYLANCFIADSGEFVSSGCYTLHEKRSAHLDELIKILNEKNISYAFRTEYANACGGQNSLAVSDETLSTDEYTYMIRFNDEQQKKNLADSVSSFCTLHAIDTLTAYVTFSDIRIEDSFEEIAKAFETNTDSIQTL